MVRSCRLCHAGALTASFALQRAPRDIQHLLSQEELARDASSPLTVYSCGNCGFVQTIPSLEETYYDDYLMTATHSPQMQELQSRQASDFVKRFGLEGRSVKEMGCGDGSFLVHLEAAGAQVSGIEPSGSARKRAQERGYFVEDGYVHDQRDLAEAPFDGFVSRQVLEHVPDIHSFLSGIRRNVKDDGVGLIEVPSLEKAVADARFYDFFADHVNYFTIETLTLVVAMNGFEVIEAFPDMHGEYIVVLVRKRQHPGLDAIAANIERLSSELSAFVAEYVGRGEKVAVWGAGGKGLSLLAETGVEGIALLVDSDVNKIGRYSPVSHLKVEAPEALTAHDVNAVVLTAMAYRNEIIGTLRNQLGFTGEIACIGNGLSRFQEV